MNRTSKTLLAVAGTAAAGVTGFMAANIYHNKKDGNEFVTEEYDDEEEGAKDLVRHDYLDDFDDLDDLDAPDDWDDFFDTPDTGVCPDDIDLKAECSIFGADRKLLPGEKKFIDEFVDGLNAITTILNNELHSIDLLARTSNMSCKVKCDKIQSNCKDAFDHCHLIAEVANEVLKVLRKEHSEEYIDFINMKIEKMEGTGYEL